MLKKLKQSNNGFTIIEVLIVLAIAALILLIVFLAVPSLQRQQRNTGRKTEGARIAASVVDFTSNNNGTQPTVAADATAIINSAGAPFKYLGTLTGAPASAAACAIGTMGAAGGSATVCSTPAAGVTFTLPTGDAVVIATGGICGSSPNVITQGALRQDAVIYTLETASGAYNAACINAQG